MIYLVLFLMLFSGRDKPKPPIHNPYRCWRCQ